MSADDQITPMDIHGAFQERVRYGDELDDWGADGGFPCHDCGVEAGEVHHLGCDVERCPVCTHQFLQCTWIGEVTDEVLP